MKLSLFKIVTLFFVLTLFFIPFDGVGMLPLGEFSKEAYIFFLLIFMVFWAINKWKQPIYIPKVSVEIELLLIFSAVLILSCLVNLPSIIENTHKQGNGLGKALGQLLVYFFFFPVVTLIFYDFIKRKRNIAKLIRRTFTACLYLAFIVGFFEVLSVVYQIPLGHTMMVFFDKIPLMDITENTWDRRISSFTNEPPSLGMFVATALPWILAFKPNKNKLLEYYFPLFALGFLTFYSDSRSGTFIVLMQLFAFFILEFGKLSIQKVKWILFIGALFIVSLPIAFIALKDNPVIEAKLERYQFLENYKSNMSNKTRLGTYIASFETIKKNPILGVGYGQAGFYILNDYPAWAAKNNPEIKRYREGKRFPPMFNIYLRILTESGIIGLLVFLCFMGFMFLRLIQWWFKGPETLKKEYMVLVLSFIGFSLTWIQFDTFRVLGFWVFFGFYLFVCDKTRALYRIRENRIP